MNRQSNELRKYLIIAEKLKLDIQSGKYKTGENIPPIRKLAEKYKVTPSTISKATAYLASMGYLNIKQGSGIRATAIDTKILKYSFALLVNKDRQDLEKLINYSFKEIFLTFLIQMNNKNYTSNILSYHRNDTVVPEDFYNKAENINGIFVLGTLPECYFNFFEKSKIPVVISERKIPDNYKSKIGTVLVNMAKLEEAVNYLTSLGHTKILYSLDNDINPGLIFKQRLEIIKKAADSWPKKSAIEIEVFQFSPNNDESIKKLQNYIKNGFKASICYNDITALNLYTLLHQLKKSIPYDFSVIGIDDIFPAKLATPSLTTIRIDRNIHTIKAIDILERLQKEDDSPKIIETIDTELIIRKSTYKYS